MSFQDFPWFLGLPLLGGKSMWRTSHR